jgi:hypothetical protein
MLWAVTDTNVRLTLFVGVDARKFHFGFSFYRCLAFVHGVTGKGPD